MEEEQTKYGYTGEVSKAISTDSDIEEIKKKRGGSGRYGIWYTVF